MESIVTALQTVLAKLTPVAALDITLTAFLIYQIMMMIKGRRAAHVLAGLTILAVFYLIAVQSRLDMLRTVLETAAPYTAFGLLVMFQTEIRRMLARIGRHGFLGYSSRLKRREFVEEILSALEPLSRTRTGALIVLERDMGLRTFVESGVPLDAVVSRDLLLAIFQPKGALHDGAVIVQNERIAAAACFLPLSMNPAVMTKSGTRHRAAIGVTEDSDCLALVVSEETGQLSVARFGEIERGLTLEQVGKIIADHLGGRSKEEPMLETDREGRIEAGQPRPIEEP